MKSTVTVWKSLAVLAGIILSASPGLEAAAPEKTDSARKTAAAPPKGVAWTNLFDGLTLRGWKVTDFASSGKVEVTNGTIVLAKGLMTGITWTNDLPTMNYEISLEAMRAEGNDFFCGLTFPVGKDPCSLIVGGWGGGVVGLSSLDGQDAANNDTTRYVTFENHRWYQIRLSVTEKKIEAWIDGDKVVDADTADKTISVRLEMEASRPMGIATWSTTGALRNLKLRRL